ncbi:MAG: hypothetical protein WAM99_24765, partial [Xanthobacteraceae bacterium]
RALGASVARMSGAKSGVSLAAQPRMSLRSCGLLARISHGEIRPDYRFFFFVFFFAKIAFQFSL